MNMKHIINVLDFCDTNTADLLAKVGLADIEKCYAP